MGGFIGYETDREDDRDYVQKMARISCPFPFAVIFITFLFHV